MQVRSICKMLGLIALLSQGVAFASNNNSNDHPNERPVERQGPPREALEACNGKKAGDSVTLTDREGRSMKAECRLIAIPERPSAPK
jgi:hypothetical protein